MEIIALQSKKLKTLINYHKYKKDKSNLIADDEQEEILKTFVENIPLNEFTVLINKTYSAQVLEANKIKPNATNYFDFNYDDDEDDTEINKIKGTKGFNLLLYYSLGIKKCRFNPFRH